MTLASSVANTEALAFEGRLFAVLPVLGETQVASGVGVAEIDGVELHTLDILSASIAGSGGLAVTDPAAAPVTSIRVSASLRSGGLGIDPFAPPFGEPAITSNRIALPGRLQVCMRASPFPPCVAGFSVPLTRSSGAVGAGIGGLITFGGTGTLMVSLYGAPFTLNSVHASATTSNGGIVTVFSTGSIGGPSFFTSTAGQPGGFLSLVTPIRTVSGYPQAPTNLIPGFLRLEIEFLPEPGVGLLLGAGAIALLALSRARRRANRKNRPGGR